MTLKSQIKFIARRVMYFGSHRYCTVCNRSSRAFLKFGVTPRADACCPMCESLERQRLAMVFFREKTNLFDAKPKRMLHVAPQRSLTKIFAKAVGDGYLTADLRARDVMERMDITDIQHPENSFDIIFCSHVLEHVPDDRKAMAEFYRTLKPDGWAVLNVPIGLDATFEDPSANSPEERLRLFGHPDHVRRYGPDYDDRLVEAGFRVTHFSPKDLLTDSQIEKFGMSNGAALDVIFCTKA